MELRLQNPGTKGEHDVIRKILTLVSLLIFTTPSLAQTEPREVAREAFAAQIAGDYEKLSLSYDKSVLSFFSAIATQLVDASEKDPSSKAALEGMFGTSGSYVVAFSEDAKSKPKTMTLKKVDGVWRVSMKPELLNAIKAALAGPAS